MHGGEFLSSPIIPIIFLAGAFFLLFKSIQNKDSIRDIRDINGFKIIDTSYEWIYFTGFIGLLAIGFHLLVEFDFHWYDVTPIDKFTHAVSGMAVTAIVLNFKLPSKRRYYYAIAIGLSWIAFVLWEVFELLFVHFNPDGFIEISDWDTAVDLWIDFLGGLAICFICDELTTEDEKHNNKF